MTRTQELISDIWVMYKYGYMTAVEFQCCVCDLIDTAWSTGYRVGMADTLRTAESLGNLGVALERSLRDENR